MGDYTFRWEHEAEEVYVTGTFDDWGKTVKLEKNAQGVFEQTVTLPHTGEKIYYKFVKDGNWVTSHTAPTETDESGNTNNVLKPTDLISSAAPGSTTAALAGAVPKANSSSPPGAFPETPATDSKEPKDFSVNPIPATAGTGNPIELGPGEKVPPAGAVTSNTISSGVHDDPELKAKDQTLSVNPIPATAGTGNPIDLKPGEKVPPSSEVTSNTINSTVKTDQASYEKSDAYPSNSNQQLNTAGGLLGVAPVTGGTRIPESGGLPMGSGAPSASDADPPVTLSSAGPGSTTAALAGKVPLEPSTRGTSGGGAAAAGVPAEVVESQKEAGVDPEASANPEAVKEKAEVEQELLGKVKPSEATGEPAPTDTAATSAAAPAGAKDLKPPTDSKPLDSRDVSPMTKHPRAGTAADGNEPAGETPKKESMGRRMSAAFKKVAGEGGSGAAGGSSSAAGTSEGAKADEPAGKEAKAKKRRSFFAKVKEAFK